MGVFEVTFLGTSGSVAYNSGKRSKYGTNTVCIAVKAGAQTIIFDTGTGICGFNEYTNYGCEHAHIFYSHYHIDHICGLLFFSDLFNPYKSFDFYGGKYNERNVYNIIDEFLKLPFHPVGITSFNAKVAFNDIAPGDCVKLDDTVKVRAFHMSHPGGAIGYRVDYGKKSLCYCTDIELANHVGDEELTKFIENTDLLITDTFFTDKNLIPGWGHSSWSECVGLAKNSGVKKLALCHFMPTITDEDITDIEKEAKAHFKQAFAAYDGLKIKI